MSDKIIKSGKDKAVAGILAILLGGFGVHRFYLRKWWGIFYLLFFWTMIPSFIGLIEGLVFLCSSDQNWDNKYNGGVHYNNDNTSVIIGLAVGFLVILMFVGILAGISIPAFVEYTARSKAAAMGLTLTQVEIAVGEYMTTNNKPPENLAEAGFTQPLPGIIKNITINHEDASLTVHLYVHPKEDLAFILVPKWDEQKNLTWSCVPGNVKSQYLPAQCKQTEVK